MLIAFEGMDGCGKSTISREVSKKVEFKYERQKILGMLGNNDDLFNSFVKYIRNSDNKYLSPMFYTFRCMLDKSSEENTIVERSVISLYYFEKDNIPSLYFDLIMQLDVKPDLIFILYADRETRIERIYNRNKNDSDLTSEEALFDGYDIMLDFADKYNLNYVVVDTLKYSKNEVIDICSNIIKEYSLLKENEKDKYIYEANKMYGRSKTLSLRRKNER